MTSARKQEAIKVDYEAMLAAVRKEAEMWRTAKDRMAERAIAAENDSEIWHKVARDEGFRLTAARDQIADLEAQRDQLAELVSEDTDIIAKRANERVVAERERDDLLYALQGLVASVESYGIGTDALGPCFGYKIAMDEARSVLDRYRENQ